MELKQKRSSKQKHNMRLSYSWSVTRDLTLFEFCGMRNAEKL